jgi:hypothetical protein
MPITTRPRPASRYGQATLDPSRPLYVCRRISRGAAGALVPGQMFDASATAPHRLRSLYSGGYVSHDPPAHGVAQVVAAALARVEQGNLPAPAVDRAPDVDAQVVVPPPASDARPAKRTRAGA